MATSPVRIDEEHKAQLERLRRELQAATGAKPTQQDTLGQLIAFAMRHRDLFVAEASWKPLTAKELRAWDAILADEEGWEAVPPEKIDDVVYGDG